MRFLKNFIHAVSDKFLCIVFGQNFMHAVREKFRSSVEFSAKFGTFILETYFTFKSFYILENFYLKFITHFSMQFTISDRILSFLFGFYCWRREHVAISFNDVSFSETVCKS
jgi:hypothetical protein